MSIKTWKPRFIGTNHIGRKDLGLGPRLGRMGNQILSLGNHSLL